MLYEGKDILPNKKGDVLNNIALFHKPIEEVILYLLMLDPQMIQPLALLLFL